MSQEIKHLHIRISTSLYRKLTFKAWKTNQKLNTIITNLINDYVKDCSEDQIKEIYVT